MSVQLIELFNRLRPSLWLRPDRVFVALALVFGLCVAFVTQPESGGDERDHFARAHQIALGEIFTVRNPSGAPGFGAIFPSGLGRDLQTLANVAYRDRDRGAFLHHLGDAAPTGQPTWVALGNAASYGPGAYAPHVVGIEIGRIVGASTLLRLYLARICGLLAYVYLVTAAIRRTPWHPWIFAACGLLPSTLGQAATVNADSLTIALSFFVTATALRMAAFPEAATRRWFVPMCIAGALMGLGKPPYMAFIFLLAIPVWRNHEKLLRPALLIVAVTVVLTVFWALYQEGHSIPQDTPGLWLGSSHGYAFHDIHPTQQLLYLLTHPFSFLAAVARMFWAAGWEGFREVVGRMGTWLAPSTLVAAFLLLVALATRQGAGPEPANFDRAARFWLLAVTLTIGLAVLIIGYTNWNAYQAPRIDELQPRYALPLLPAFLIAALPMSPKLGSQAAYARNAILTLGIAAALIITATLIICWHLTGAPLWTKLAALPH